MTRTAAVTAVTGAIAVVAVAFGTAGAMVGGHAASVTVSSVTLTPLRTCVITATPATTSAEIDASVDEGAATTNTGAAATMNVTSAKNGDQRAYVEFQLGGCIRAIPATATIRQATLRLYMSAESAACRTVDVYPVAGAWAESTITWNNQPFGTTLNNPASGARTASFSAGSAAGCQNTTVGYITGATVTNDVENVVSGSSTNFGWMLRDDAEGINPAHTETFDTKNLGTTSHAPQLVISYVDVP